MISHRPMTADELLEMPSDGFRYELVAGELRKMSPSGFEHGEVVVRVTVPLARFVTEHDLGVVLGAATGFKLFHDPDTVRAPDVAFVCQDRRPPVKERKKFASLAPDLAVEVVSPSDTPAEVEAKVDDYLQAGVRLIWVLDPDSRTVTEYHASGPTRTLTADQTLDGGDVLPGFTCPVAALFPPC